jgi:hypothetical protein
MLNAKVGKGEVSLEASGNVSELLADIVTVIRCIHEKLEGDAKEFFEDSLEKAVNEKIYAITVEELKKKRDEKMEEFFKDILGDDDEEEFLKKLKKLKKLFD